MTAAMSAPDVERAGDLAAWLRVRAAQRDTILAVVADLGAVLTTRSLGELARVLDDDELRRMRELRFDGDRAAYAASHAVLRGVLAVVLGCEAAAIRFERRASRFGPLRIAADGSHRCPPISLSHGGRFVAVAVGTSDDLGIDVEPARPPAELEPLCALMYGDRERRVLDAVPFDARAGAILRAWCAKEAALKAAGVGLETPPADAVLSYDAERFPIAASVALGGRVRTLRVWSFDPIGDASAVAAVAAPPGARVACAFGDAAALLQRFALSTASDRSMNPPANRSAAERLRKNVSGSP